MPRERREGRENLRGPAIFERHDVVLADGDGILFETFPGFISFFGHEFRRRGFTSDFGQAWEATDFEQIQLWALEQGIPEKVVSKVSLSLWRDPFIYRFAPRTQGSKEFVDWVKGKKRLLAHTSRPKETEFVSRESLEQHFPQAFGDLLMSSTGMGFAGNSFKINNAEFLRAIFLDDQPLLGITFADYIDELRSKGKTPRSHLIILPYAQIPVPERLLDPGYQHYITVLKNILGVTQDLERAKRFLSGKQCAHLLAN